MININDIRDEIDKEKVEDISTLTSKAIKSKMSELKIKVMMFKSMLRHELAVIELDLAELVDIVEDLVDNKLSIIKDRRLEEELGDCANTVKNIKNKIDKI